MIAHVLLVWVLCVLKVFCEWEGVLERVELTDEVHVSRLVYGMWRIGDVDDTSPKHVQEKMEACLEQGISTFDQADIYGEYGAEAILGACLAQAPHLREKVEIVTKCGIVAPFGVYADRRVKYYDTSAAHIKASVDRSLGEMKTDYVDLLLIHRPDPFMDHSETGAVLDALVASGKVRAVGVSNFKPHDWSLLQSAMSNKLATNQIELSVMSNESLVNGELAFLQEKGVSPMAWSPLGGGELFQEARSPLALKLQEIATQNESTIADVAIAWLLAHPSKIIPVLGTNNLSRIKQISNADEIEIDRETWFDIYTAANGCEVP